jgi:nitrate reductase delta subunit
MQALKALSALLCYPSEALQAAMPEIAAAVSEEGLDLGPLGGSLSGGDLFDLQAAYVDLFDRGRRLSLHLFEHVHGESRDRGQAMVDLANLYEQGGLLLAPGEMPDYLPTFLEYASTRPRGEAIGLLGNIAPILGQLHDAAARRGTPYAAVFAALLGLAGARAVATEAEPPPDDLAALDDEWEEKEVRFGPGEDLSNCSPDRLRTRLRAANRDPRVSI